jgi:ADP-heptose:LPS heptosyltransferase
VLVFTQYCPGSIGEQVVQIPFFHLLRQRHPGATIVAVAPQDSSSVLETLRAADEFVTYPVKAGVGALLGLAGSLRRRGAVAAYQHRHLSTRTTLLARLSTGAPLIGFQGNWNRLLQQESHDFDKKIYIGRDYLKLVGADLPEFRRGFSRENDGYMLVIPGGLAPRKRFPLERYVAIARTLSSTLPTHFLLGPGMQEEKSQLDSLPDGFTVHAGLSIARVGELVRRAALVLANDCGPAHFAHIYDIPRVSIFNIDLNYDHWFDAGVNGRLVKSPRPDGIHEVPLEMVLEEARALLSRGESRPTTIARTEASPS